MSKHTDPQRISPEQIAGLLTRATSQLDDDTVSALRRARSVALEKQVLHKPAFALSTGHGAHWLMPHTAHQWLATAILLVTVFVGGIGYWHHANELELSRLDVAILTDELPMEVFVDQ
jgi:hypothetical protein